MVKRLLSSPSKKNRANRSPIKGENKTAPCTPSPTYQDTKIIVRTRTEARRSSNFSANNEKDKLNVDSNSLQDGVNYFEDDCDNSTYISDLSATQYTHSTKRIIRDVHYSNETDGKSTDQKFPLQDPGTLLQTVMGSCVSDIVSRVGLGHNSLREDTEPRNIWGMAPSEDDSTSDEEESYFEENDHHEDIELVYQPVPEKEEDTPQQLLCQPCKEDGHSPRFTPHIAKMLASTNLPQRMKKKNKNKTAESQKEATSPTKGSQHLLKGDEETTTDVLVMKKSEMVESLSIDDLNINKNSKSEAHKSQLRELASSEDAGSQKKVTADVERSISNTKWNSLKLKSKKKRSQQEKPETNNQRKYVPSRMSQAIGRLSKTKKKKKDTKTQPTHVKNPGRWRVAEDPNTKKKYFYHSGTKEVTWQKPPGFNEWKPIIDKERNKHYFYNCITKETTWDRPKDFEEWRAIRDTNFKNRIYYYNVLTKERRWNEPKEYKEQQNVISDQNCNTKEPNLRTKNRESVHADSRSYESTNSQHKQATSNIECNARNTSAIKISSNETNEYDLDHILRSIDSSNKTDTKEPITTRPLAPPAVELNSKQLHLMKLLTSYNPNEHTANAIFVRRIAVGKEEKIIDELEGLVEDTPFDEIPAATQCFLKKHQIDQHLNDDDDVIKVSSLTRTNSLKSTKTVRTLASHKTNYSTVSMNSRVKSNMTETTNKVNNTSSRRMFHSKLNHSTIPCTEEKVDEEDLSQSTPTSLTSAEAETCLSPQKNKMQIDNIQNLITELEVPDARRQKKKTCMK